MFLAPFLITVAGGNAHALFRCNMDRVARPICCCPQMQESPETPVGATISDVCCCTIKISDAAPAGEARSKADRSESGKTFPASVAVVSPVARVLASPRVMGAGARSPCPPNPRSLLSLKTSFLR
jgi:hypothetical protein